MKKFHQLCAASALVLVLTLSAFAGEIQTPRATTSTNQPAAVAITGETGTASAPSSVETSADRVWGLTLSILWETLALF